MKTVTFAALALLGAGIAFSPASPASAVPLSPGSLGISADQSSNVIEVGKRRSGKRYFRHKRRRGHDRDFHFGLGIPLLFGLGYGLGHHRYYNDRPECYGDWHKHRNGRLHCHGDLIY
jgi:hypothetical protein